MNNTTHIQTLNKGWEFHQIGKPEWYSAQVPGCVHLALLNNKLIEDPFYRDNEKLVQWIDKMYWEYRAKFNVKPEIYKKEHIQILFDGLDTFANVSLNDQQIIQADNMFHPWEADVKSLLKKKDNVLLVRFRSPILELQQKVGQMPYRLPAAMDEENGTRPFTRKAQYHYEWDWGPRLVTSGIWRNVKLVAWDTVRITDFNIVVKKLNGKKASLELTIEIESTETLKTQLSITDDRTKIKKKDVIELTSGLNIINKEIELSNPEIWWPSGYGEQPLYTFTAEIASGEEKTSMSRRIGLRTIQLLCEEDEWGSGFTFVVNDVPIFSKGANWIPGDNFTPRISADKYRNLLESAVRANMNMIRIWGGGIYEEDLFYDLCDELGLLVWQDFMFACAMYPADEAFLSSVKREAVYQVRRLRTHPCLALWCGNNEIGQGWNEWGWDEKLPESVWEDYGVIFHSVLKEVCEEHDPSRAYWPTSPGNEFSQMSEAQDHSRGDAHYWGIWHGKEPFEYYEKIMPRFVSEYGFQSFPEPKAIERFTIAEDRDIFSPVLLNHQRCSKGNSLIKTYMEQYYKVPVDFNSFVLISQLLQAEGIRSGTEHFRRIYPRCAGSLYWQLNDCWPAASWASIDYYGNWKALHYYAKRFYAPILISPVDKNGLVQLYIVSDRLDTFRTDLNVELRHTNGTLLNQWKEDIKIRPLESAVYFTVEKSSFPDEVDLSEMFIYCSLENKGTFISENTLFFVHPKAFSLEEPRYTTEVIPSNSGFLINLSAENLVRFVFLDSGGIDGNFDDNFFDLHPGVNRSVLFSAKKKIGIDRYRKSLSIVTLFDLMKE